MTTTVAVPTMKAAQVTAAGASLTIVELPIAEPRPRTSAHQRVSESGTHVLNRKHPAVVRDPPFPVLSV